MTCHQYTRSLLYVYKLFHLFLDDTPFCFNIVWTEITSQDNISKDAYTTFYVFVVYLDGHGGIFRRCVGVNFSTDIVDGLKQFEGILKPFVPRKSMCSRK